jgi:hypothetical protein
MLCQRCGTDNAVGAQFCSRCWAPMQDVAPPSPSQPGRSFDTAPRSAYETMPQTPASQFGPMQNVPPRPMTNPFVRPSRSASARAIVALVLGALSSFVWCPALSIAAWLVGRSELKAIERGQSHPEGHTIARVGYILGIVFTIAHVGIMALFGVIYGAAIVLWILAMLAAIASGS